MFKQFVDQVKSGTPIIFVQTHEEARALSYLKKGLDSFKFLEWDTIRGVVNPHLTDKELKAEGEALKAMTVPPLALDEFFKKPARETEDHRYDQSVLFMMDMPRFLESVEVIRTIKNNIKLLKERMRCLVFIGPTAKIPPELERDVTVLHLPLPDLEMVKLLLSAHKDALGISGTVSDDVLREALGMTLSEIEDAFFLSVTRHGDIRIEELREAKLAAIKKNDLLEVYQPVDPSLVGGLEVLKDYMGCRAPRLNQHDCPPLNGVLLIGPPGTGKSLSARLIASILGRTLIRFDFAKMKNQYVGGSEERLRMALSMIDSFGKVVVWMDEIEKAFGGVQSSNHTDGGTTSAMAGMFFTYMQESGSERYFVATCNDTDVLLNISQGALVRRFDDIFFLDLPTLEERKAILEIKNREYNTNVNPDLCEQMELWSCGEIDRFVKNSLFDGVDRAFKNVKPLARQNFANIERARNWASANAILANMEPVAEAA